ncbi:hypothetical protein [Pseudomonas luteola]|uniref:hypothetical protein n=1 Tax=Pseudomonas luteola TaxID=47886 RepID=UPI0011BD63F3|nr:hypothetical protein [Pseudomonas luteola]
MEKLGWRDRRISPDSGSLFQTFPSFTAGYQFGLVAKKLSLRLLSEAQTHFVKSIVTSSQDAQEPPVDYEQLSLTPALSRRGVDMNAWYENNVLHSQDSPSLSDSGNSLPLPKYRFSSLDPLI